jgi:ferric-dicitrate binding protein FerR (iron transport regulator)
LNREVFLQLVDKFLAGKASAEEEQLLHNYFESFQQSSGWNEQELGPRDAMEQKLFKQLGNTIGNKKTNGGKAGVFRMQRKQWMLAAGFLAVLIGSYLLWNLLSKFYGPFATKEVVTGMQERKQLQLADGTVIWLEPGSRLNYPAKFKDSIREITFTGEAFFEVAKDPYHPFIIHTGTIRTRVLGTSFTVKAYDSLSQEITVVTGRVLVQADKKNTAGIQPVTVIPNQKASWNNNNRRIEKIQLSSTAYYAQRRYGKFIYQGETVASVLDDIQHQYNVQVHYDPSMRGCTFYGDFDSRQPVGKVLTSLATALNAQLTKGTTQNTYRLLGGGCFPIIL